TSLKIVLVGRGHEQKNLQQYLAQHHLQARVLFLTNVSDEMLPFLYQQAKCVVYPSVFEGFGLPIVEALQCGVPVITGKNACFVEAGGEGILYVNQTNPEEIAGAVLQLLENEALAKKLVEKGQAHIQQFRAENVTKRLMEIYLE
ncbi:MAG: glycosyltransferase, partial [Bacteroidia bacterium]